MDRIKQMGSLWRSSLLRRMPLKLAHRVLFRRTKILTVMQLLFGSVAVAVLDLDGILRSGLCCRRQGL